MIKRLNSVEFVDLCPDILSIRERLHITVQGSLILGYVAFQSCDYHLVEVFRLHDHLQVIQRRC